MHIKVNTGTTGSLDMTKINFYPYNTGIWDANGFDLDMSYSKIYMVSYGWRFDSNYIDLAHAVIQGGSYGGIITKHILFSGNIYMYARVSSVLTNAKLNGFEIQTNEIGVELENVKSDSPIRINFVDVTGNNPVKIIDCKCSRFYPYLWADNDLTDLGTDVYEVRNLETTGSASFTFYRPNMKEFRFYDLIDSYHAGNENPGMDWRAGTEDCQVLLFHKLDLKIIDKSNNAISGVSIVLKDKNGTIVLTDTTDGNGEVGDDIKSMVITHGGSRFASVYTTQNPFTIKIKKAGYQTYKTKFTLDSKTDWTITMKQISINIDSEVLC
jgi:hypothetical protein